jgi:SAM-dependent methyltransferase
MTMFDDLVRRVKYRGRGPVVHLDRLGKGRMIRAILEDYGHEPIRGRRILDIGCGNGGISALFSQENEVTGVDIEDKRRPEHRDFDFRLIDDEHLPFDDGAFDIVLSHHVIEHVADQGLHLDEIRRVLRRSGICYLATPNRSSPFMEGHVGNDSVLRYEHMAPLFEAHGLRVREYGYEVMTQPERFLSEKRWGRYFPAVLAQRLRPIYPSHMFVLRPSE